MGYTILDETDLAKNDDQVTMYLPSEVLERVIDYLEPQDVKSFLHFRPSRYAAQKRLFQLVSLHASQPLPPRHTWPFIQRLECHGMDMDRVRLAILEMRQLNALVMEECTCSQPLELGAIQSLCLDQIGMAHVSLHTAHLKLFEGVLDDHSLVFLASCEVDELHLTVKDPHHLPLLLPYLTCYTLYIYADDLFEMPMAAVAASSVDTLVLLNEVSESLGQYLLAHIQPRHVRFEVQQLHASWTTLLRSSSVSVVIDGDFDMDCATQWSYPIQSIVLGCTPTKAILPLCSQAEKIWMASYDGRLIDQ